MGKRKKRSELGNGVELDVPQSLKKKKSAKPEQPTEASASKGISLRHYRSRGLILLQEGAFTDTGTNELDIQTFYSQEDKYSALHSRYYSTSEKGRRQMKMEGKIRVQQCGL